MNHNISVIKTDEVFWWKAYIFLFTPFHRGPLCRNTFNLVRKLYRTRKVTPHFIHNIMFQQAFYMSCATKKNRQLWWWVSDWPFYVQQWQIPNQNLNCYKMYPKHGDSNAIYRERDSGWMSEIASFAFISPLVFGVYIFYLEAKYKSR